MRRSLRTQCVAALLLWPGLAAANLLTPADPFGLHARDMGSGRALALFGSGFSAALSNPAALAQDGEGQLSLGYVYSRPAFTFDGQAVRAESNNIPLLGLKLSLKNLTSLDRQISFALAFGLDNNFGTLLSLSDGDAPTGQFLSQGRRQLLLAPGFGMQLTDWFHVGAGMQISVIAGAQMQFRTTLGGETSGESVVMGGSNRVAPVLGMLIGPFPLSESNRLRFAVSYRAAGWYVLNVDASASATVAGSPLTTLPIQMSFVDAFRPHEWTLGAQVDLGRVTVGASLEYALYQELTGLLRDVDTVRKDAGLEFANVFLPRLGAEYRTEFGLSGRVGYAYEPTPLASPAPSLLNAVDNSRHVISVGAGYVLSQLAVLKNPISFDLGYQLGVLVPRTFTLMQEDGASQDVKTGGILHALNATLTLRF